MLRRSPNASISLRKVNSLSIVDSDVALPRRMNQRCCAKHIPILAVIAALKMVVKRMETAETWDCVR
jgi:hypothetical protein